MPGTRSAAGSHSSPPSRATTIAPGVRDVLLIVFAGVLVGIILNALSYRIGRLTGLGHRMSLAVATISLFGLHSGAALAAR